MVTAYGRKIGATGQIVNQGAESQLRHSGRKVALEPGRSQHSHELL